jgi:AraC-like DNA-binding protein
MKTELERIVAHENSSLRLMVNPNLSDFFFWHFHPEYELVFIDGANGTRHVGKHISRFEGSDLVFIGSSTPELHAVHMLFEESKQGVAFGKNVILLVGDRLKKLHRLGYFEQFLEVLSILQLLSESTEKELLHNHPVENPHTLKEQGRLKTIYQFLDDNYQRKIELSEVATLSNLTNAAFCRYFKRMTKLTFTEFVNHYRIDRAKNLLRQDNNITETCFQCGFESISYFNKIFKKVTGVNPLAFKKRHQSLI